MASSQQQSTNPNNNNNINQTQIQNSSAYDDYEEVPTITSVPQYTTSNINPQTQFVTDYNYDYSGDSAYYDNYNNEGYGDDDDDDMPSDLENELPEGTGDESYYNDDIDDAFAKYEKEYSKYWTTTKSKWENFTDAEQERMIDEMHECMTFMTQQYSQASVALNPEAAEFRPSWLPTSEASAGLSSVPLEGEKANEGAE